MKTVQQTAQQQSYLGLETLDLCPKYRKVRLVLKIKIMLFLFSVTALRSLGTYAGNDAIVAFSRLHQITVIIHQLNSPFFVVCII